MMVAGRPIDAFPSPYRLRELRDIPGLTAQKVGRLRDIADPRWPATSTGGGCGSCPRKMRLRGCESCPASGGSRRRWSSSEAPERRTCFESEPRFLAAMARAYGVKRGDVPALERIATRWSPYRSWVALLFRASFA